MSESLNFKIPAIRVTQREKEGQAIYTGKIKLKDIYHKHKQRFDINIWKDSQPIIEKGYQRDPDPKGIEKIADYIVDENITKNPLFPTAVLVNSKEDLEFLPIGSNSDIGFLNITATLWIVDGQHRIKAFEKIMSNLELREKYGDYEIPIVVLTGFNTKQEIEQFFIINSKQKKVKTDLAQQIYLSLAMDDFNTGIIPLKERWKLNAVKITQNLRDDSDYANSVWASRIEMPNEDRRVKKLRIVSQNTFVSSLKPFFIGGKAKWPANVINEKQGKEIVEEGTELIYKFWRRVNNVYSTLFQSPKDYSLFNSVGVYSMHLFLINVLHENKGSEYGKILDIAEEKLKYAKEQCGFGDNFWRRDNKMGKRTGRSAAAYSSGAGQNLIATKIFLGQKITE